MHPQALFTRPRLRDRLSKGLLSLLLAGAACAPEGPEQNCPAQALSAYCQGTCPDHDAFVQRIRAEIDSYPAQGVLRCVEAFTGRCGPLRVVSSWNGLYGARAYFTEDGAMVAVHYTSDAGCLMTDYGEVPTCTPTVETDLCKQ